jgi:hypothetical protein
MLVFTDARDEKSIWRKVKEVVEPRVFASSMTAVAAFWLRPVK